jgi:RNase P protein component
VEAEIPKRATLFPRQPSPLKEIPTVSPSLQELDDPMLPEDVRRRLLNRLTKKPYMLALTIDVPKKKVSKLATRRNKIRKRIREAFRAIVQRGLQDDGETIIEADAGVRKWLMGGYEYIVKPEPDVYGCEWPLLVRSIRKALTETKASPLLLILSNLPFANICLLSRKRLKRLRLNA